jgi:excinuclease UvrABC ATPase subunit
VVAAGTPSEVMECERSYTGAMLKEMTGSTRRGDGRRVV